MSEFEPIDESIIISAFFESLREHGIIPRDNFTPIMDGQIHRFPLESDRHGQKTGAYKIFSNGWPVWFIQDFRQHGDMIKCVLDRDLVPRESRPVMSRDECERMKADNERKKQEDKRLQEENELILRDKAFSFFHSELVNQNVDAVNQHEYMLKKQVILPPNSNCYAGIDDKGNLVFPLFDSDFMNIKLPHRYSLQFISQDSQKWFYKGISIKGLCYPIRQFTSNTLFITEGIATAFSIDEFTHRKFSVIAALNCGNLLDVCKNLRTYLAATDFKNQQIIIAADNDKNKAGENAAKKVIDAGYADGYRMPPIVGMDWNDYINHLKGHNE